MKKMRKLIAVVLALTVAMTMGIASTSMVFAADGQGTLTVTNATAGQTYKAYKIFNALYDTPSDISKGVTYTVSEANKSKVSTTLFDVSTAKASNDEYIVTPKTTTTDAQILAWAKENYSQFDSTGTALTLNANKATASATLDYGYYYVTSSLGSVVSIDSVNADAKIVDKNESKPDGPDKVITAEDSSVNADLDQTNVSLTSNDAAVGSVESFKVSFDAVNWVQDEESDSTPGTGTGTKTKVTVYNFQDKPTGLDIDTATIKVTVNGTDVTGTVTDIAKATDGTVTFKIPWVDSSGNFLYETKTAGSELIPVVVTYNATVTDAAATAVAPNEVTVKYNNNTELGKDTTTTYTYKFDLEKVDENKTALDGAEFQLFYARDGAAEGIALKFSLVDRVYHYDPNGSVTNIKPTGDAATASIIGLDNTTYILKEVVVPEGYTQAADTTVSSLSRVDATGTAVAKVSVENKKGSVLPSTGGIGTTIFYILGALLVVGCGIILIARRRSSANN